MNLANEGEEDLSQKHTAGVKLALELCEAVPGQFKLIETPLNSFLLVTNVTPEDNRPWKSHLTDDLDFSSITFPKLQKLNHILSYATGTEAPPQSPPPELPTCSPFLVYQTREWQLALTLNKDPLVLEAMEALSTPENWQGIIPEDPLAYLWLLFYGRNSFCAQPDCLFYKTFHFACPVLLPPHLYKPQENPKSFIRHVCQYVKFLYHNQQNPMGELKCPFGEARLHRALQNLDLIKETEAYLSRTCLVCHLYKQNYAVSQNLSDSCGCIILGGIGDRYITHSVSTHRLIETGDTVVIPSYDLPHLLRDLQLDGTVKQS